MSYKIESPLPVIEGGTGVQANTVYAVLCGGTTTTGPIQSIASVGTAGQVLTSNDAGALPTFQTISVPGTVAQSFPTDSGTATPVAGVVNIIANNAALNAGSTVLFSASTNTITLNVTDASFNTIVGKNSGNATLLGMGAGDNVIFGGACGTALTDGDTNIIIGQGSGINLTTGSYNILLGSNVGSSFTSSEESNICIGYGTSGTTGNSYVMRIGTSTGSSSAGQLNASFIQGIRGITPTVNDGIPVYVNSLGQLGTVGSGGGGLASIEGNTGGAQTGPAIILTTGTSGATTGSSTSFAGSTNTITFNVTDANNNTIIGLGAGNGSITSVDNVVLGKGSGTSISSGTGRNVIIGTNTATALTSSINNTIIGYGSGAGILNNGQNTIIGSGSVVAGNANTNTVIGYGNATGSLSGSNNTIVGTQCGTSLGSGGPNVIIGTQCGTTLATGGINTIIGYQVGRNFDLGNRNILIGATNTASAYTGSESNNIILNAVGVVGESNVLRLGNATGTGTTQLNESFIHGIRGITPTVNDGIPVYINSVGQLGTVGTSGAPVVFITTVSTTINNVTGDGANYTVVYNNIIVDTDSAYDNTTGIFTAPSTGYYQFNASVCAQGLISTNDYEIRIGSSVGQELEGPYLVAGLIANGGYFNGSVSGVMSLTTGDQVFVTFISNGGGADTVDVYNVYSWFNGFKIA